MYCYIFLNVYKSFYNNKLIIGNLYTYYAFIIFLQHLQQQLQLVFYCFRTPSWRTLCVVLSTFYVYTQSHYERLRYIIYYIGITRFCFAISIRVLPHVVINDTIRVIKYNIIYVIKHYSTLLYALMSFICPEETSCIQKIVYNVDSTKYSHGYSLYHSVSVSPTIVVMALRCKEYCAQVE